MSLESALYIRTLPEGNKDEENGFFVHMPTKHVRSIAAQRECSQEGLVGWCLPQLDKKNLWKASAKTPILHVTYHLKSDRDDKGMDWFDSWKDGEGCVTNKAA